MRRLAVLFLVWGWDLVADALKADPSIVLQDNHCLVVGWGLRPTNFRKIGYEVHLGVLREGKAEADR